MVVKIQLSEVAGAEFEPVLTLGDGSLREPIVIKRAIYKGWRRISIRAHYRNRNDVTETLNPGRRGIEVPEEYLDRLIESLQLLQEVIRGDS